MPTPKISLKDFKILLLRRSKALSRRHSATPSKPNSIPKPNPNPTIKQEQEQEPTQHPTYEDKSDIDPNHKLQLDPPTKAEECEEGAPEDQIESDDGEIPVKPIGGLDILVDAKTVLPDINSNLVDQLGNSLDDIKAVPLNPSSETNNKEVALNDKEERKREVEEKLKILNARKHNLVQVLKQILNAEEELKRRSNMQGLAIRPSVSLQVDVTNDSGSMTRHLTPRMGSDGNPGGDVEGGEADDSSNQNMHSHHMLRMSSMSPSSDSPHRRPSHSVVPHPSRATLGASASPSRFAPTGQQGHPASLPTVSVSGTNYIASSPSPAASSGTSVFRDGRRPSSWN